MSEPKFRYNEISADITEQIKNGVYKKGSLLPSEGQLEMLLQSLRFQGHVGRMIAVARYVDRNGVHEAALDQMPNTPFAIGVGGEHRVYIEFQ